jgi:hypothetical protein
VPEDADMTNISVIKKGLEFLIAYIEHDKDIWDIRIERLPSDIPDSEIFRISPPLWCTEISEETEPPTLICRDDSFMIGMDSKAVDEIYREYSYYSWRR